MKNSDGGKGGEKKRALWEVEKGGGGDFCHGKQRKKSNIQRRKERKKMDPEREETSWISRKNNLSNLQPASQTGDTRWEAKNPPPTSRSPQRGDRRAFFWRGRRK